MHYREFAPAPDLASVVETMWTVTGSPGDRIRVLADACTDLIALDDGARSVLFNGPMTMAESSQLHFPVTTGLRFRPGVLACVVPDLRLDAMLNADLEVPNPRPGTDQADGLTGYVRFLMEQGRIRTHPDVDGVLAAMADGTGALAAAYRMATASERTIQRLFQVYVGMSPRQTAKVLRQNHVGRALRSGVGSIAELASAHGYADQAHLTRHFGELAGIPPGRFLQEVGRDGIVQDASA